MAINLAKEEVNIGGIKYKWKVKEYEQYDRDRRWYIGIFIMASLLMLFAFYTANYFFILVIILFSIIVFLHHHHEPNEVNFAITETGIVIGNTYYRYSELNAFWIIYNPPEVKNLYFSQNKIIRHRLSIPLYDYDPRPIRLYLGQYIDEEIDEVEEPLSEKMARSFKI